MHEKVCTFLPVFVVSAAGSVDVVVVVVVLMVTLMSIMPLSSSLSQIVSASSLLMATMPHFLISAFSFDSGVGLKKF